MAKSTRGHYMFTFSLWDTCFCDTFWLVAAIFSCI